MFHRPEYTRNMSLCASEILKDLGVNEKIVLKKRRNCLLVESLHNLTFKLLDMKTPRRVSGNPLKSGTPHMFGSQIEGTTTGGLNSDNDFVVCFNKFNIIHKLEDWERGSLNYLMIRNDDVSPGYCMLQLLRGDVPLPFTSYFLPEKHHFCDGTGRILLPNTLFDIDNDSEFETVKHGPAESLLGQNGLADTDFVYALPCKTWPINARKWLSKRNRMWPTKEMKKYCATTECFVVGVGHTCSDYELLEWRISTCHAERCLMFSLNITQLQCYVLMKMILKTYITPYFENTISSFMCKTLLFHCIENTSSSMWKEDNLLGCLSYCVFALYKSVENEYCPHFIINVNNLMKGKIPGEVKPYILKILQNIIASGGRALLGIECDNLGRRLETKMNSSYERHGNILAPNEECQRISGWLLFITGKSIQRHVQEIVGDMTYGSSEMVFQTLKTLLRLVHIYNDNKGFVRDACRLLAPVFCTHAGAALASLNIQQWNNISQQALSLTSMGLNSDVSSGKLKHASMLYCVGDIEGTELLLRDIEDNYDRNAVEPVCGCYNYEHKPLKNALNTIASVHDFKEAIPKTIAYCVVFLPCEINCTPHELRFEMFRLTQENRAIRDPFNTWMNWAVVDSLPFLYFLQYKTYGYLGRQYDKERALNNLVRSIDSEVNLGHKETALNLLGQCMEQEERVRDAFNCYLRSLNLRQRNNAARFHICRLLSNVINAN